MKIKRMYDQGWANCAIRYKISVTAGEVRRAV